MPRCLLGRRRDVAQLAEHPALQLERLERCADQRKRSSVLSETDELCAASPPSLRQARTSPSALSSKRAARRLARFTSPTGFEACLHLGSVVRVESVTSAGGRKGTLTRGLSFLSVPVATPQFPTSCGIDTGSKGGGELQPPFESVFGQRCSR